MTNTLFARLSLNQKLLVGFGLMALLLVGVAYIGYYGLNEQEEEIHVFSDAITPSLVELGKMQRGGRGGRDVAQLTFSTNDQPELDRLAGRYEEAIATIEDSFKRVEGTPQIAGEEAVAPALSLALAGLKTETQEMLKNSRQVNPKTSLTDPAAADYLEKKFQTSFRPVRDAYTQAIGDYLELYTATATAEAAGFKALARRPAVLTLSGVAVGLFFAFGTGVVLARSLNAQLRGVSVLLQEESVQLRGTFPKARESVDLAVVVDRRASLRAPGNRQRRGRGE